MQLVRSEVAMKNSNLFKLRIDTRARHIPLASTKQRVNGAVGFGPRYPIKMENPGVVRNGDSSCVSN
jgi:hypothetical protein